MRRKKEAAIINVDDETMIDNLPTAKSRQKSMMTSREGVIIKIDDLRVEPVIEVFPKPPKLKKEKTEKSKTEKVLENPKELDIKHFKSVAAPLPKTNTMGFE